MALAELGRCSEAAQWQRKMIAAAEHERTMDFVSKLRAGLRRYEQAGSCRPAVDLSE
jgi:hypothetical protein